MVYRSCSSVIGVIGRAFLIFLRGRHCAACHLKLTKPTHIRSDNGMRLLALGFPRKHSETHQCPPLPLRRHYAELKKSEYDPSQPVTSISTFIRSSLPAPIYLGFAHGLQMPGSHRESRVCMQNLVAHRNETYLCAEQSSHQVLFHRLLGSLGAANERLRQHATWKSRTTGYIHLEDA